MRQRPKTVTITRKITKNDPKITPQLTPTKTNLSTSRSNRNNDNSKFIMKKSSLNDEELKKLREKILIDMNINSIEKDELLNLHNHLREFISECCIKKEFEKAKKSDLLLTKIKNKINTNNKNNI